MPAIIAELKKQGADDIIVFVGGVIPRQDYEMLYEAGVKGIYGPGTPIPASAKDVLEQIKKALGLDMQPCGRRSAVRAGADQRRAIAKAITLLESTRADHRAQARRTAHGACCRTAESRFAWASAACRAWARSTFIEVLGLYLIDQGHRVAVLTIDPSSTVSGGSILGDKTRMEKLSVHERAYIRPSPSSGTLGGVAEKTREAMLVCEAAGYDIVIVETVGVGQSETAVAGMTDMFVLMQLPNAGDDLQAIKKGVMELADLVVINKADIDADAATRAQAQITSSLRLLGQHGHPDHAHARRQNLASAGDSAQCAARHGRGRVLGGGVVVQGAAGRQWPLGIAPPAPVAGLDVGAHRRGPEARVQARRAGGGAAAATDGRRGRRTPRGLDCSTKSAPSPRRTDIVSY